MSTNSNSLAPSNKDKLISVPKLIQSLSPQDVLDFYKISLAEKENPEYTHIHIEKLLDLKSGHGRMIKNKTYFKENYCRPLAEAISEIFGKYKNPRILDICCGTGSQSILFAYFGASVIGVDIDDDQIDTARQRIKFYENIFDKSLDINILKMDVKTVDWSKLGDFDVIYTHIGMGRLEKAEDIFRRLAPVVRSGGMMIFKNGNPDCLWLRLLNLQPNDSSRNVYKATARQYNFNMEQAEGTIGLPRQLWLLPKLALLSSRILRKWLYLQINIQYVFRKLDTR